MEKVWATRKIARNVARANMRRAGVAHANKPRRGVRNGIPAALPSFFAQKWRSYAD